MLFFFGGGGGVFYFIFFMGKENMGYLDLFYENMEYIADAFRLSILFLYLCYYGPLFFF